MSLIFIPRAGMPTNAVSMGSNDFYSQANSGQVFSGVKFGSDGNLYERQPAGGWSRFGTWLYNGSASTYYLSRVVNFGALSTDGGAGPIQMNADIIYDVATFSLKSANLTFDISDDISGSPIIDTQTWTFEAESGFN